MYTCIHSVKAHSVYIQYVYIHTFSKFPFSMLRRAFTEWRALTECMFTARAGLLVLAHHLDQVGSPDHSVVSDDASLSLSLSLSLSISLSRSPSLSLSLSHTHTLAVGRRLCPTGSQKSLKTQNNQKIWGLGRQRPQSNQVLFEMQNSFDRSGADTRTYSLSRSLEGLVASCLSREVLVACFLPLEGLVTYCFSLEGFVTCCLLLEGLVTCCLSLEGLVACCLSPEGLLICCLSLLSS